MNRVSTLMFVLAACATGPTAPVDAEPELPAGLSARLAIPEVDGPHLSLLEANQLQLQSQRSVKLDGRVIDAAIADDSAYAVLYDRGVVQRVSLEGEPGEVLPVGLGPTSIVIDGSRAFVAVSLQDQVVEIDLESMEILRRVPVTGQPRWLTLIDSDTLAITGARSERVTVMDRMSGDLREITVPTVRHDGIEYDRRVTGPVEPTIVEGQSLLLVPVLHSDTTLSVSVRSPIVPPDLPPPYYVQVPAAPTDLGRMVPAVVALDVATGDVARHYVVVGAASSESGQVIYGGPVTELEARGADVYAVLGSEDGLVGFELEGRSGPAFRGLTVPDLWVASTPAGPHRLYRVGTTDWLYSFVDGSISMMGPGFLGALDRNRLTSIRPQHRLEREVGDPQVELGRRLFHSSRDPRVSLTGSGVACSLCHVDGHGDGHTWHVDAGPRQTPSLGGEVSLTAPFTWTDAVPTLEHEIVLTSQGRMASQGELEHARAIAAYVDVLPHPPSLETSFATDLDADAVARGQAVFEGTAECASCHQGEQLTDGLAHDMFGLTGVDTPTLRGLRATPPYLHDGRAADLVELIEISEQGGMGRTEHLSGQEKADLVAYLRSL